MSLKHGLLGLLTYKPMTGYELMKIFNESLYFFWSAQTSQIYRELETLEKNGWVNSEHVAQTEKPNKNIFTLTSLGKNEFVRWLDEHTAGNMSKVRDAMTMRVYFGSEGDPKMLVKELIQFKRNSEEFMERIGSVMKELDMRESYIEKRGEQVYWQMAIRRGYCLAEANVKWVDECLEVMMEIINDRTNKSDS